MGSFHLMVGCGPGTQRSMQCVHAGLEMPFKKRKKMGGFIWAAADMTCHDARLLNWEGKKTKQTKKNCQLSFITWRLRRLSLFPLWSLGAPAMYMGCILVHKRPWF